jgi:hypothetical protein
MEKKHRAIVVDGKTYGWTVKSSGKDQSVTIWDGKTQLFTTGFRLTSIMPHDIAEVIKEYILNIWKIERDEALDREWTKWLDTVPWSGYGGTVEESDYIFKGKRKAWMKKMVKKYDVTMPELEARYNHD